MLYRGVEGSPDVDKPQIGKTTGRLAALRYSVDTETTQGCIAKVVITTEMTAELETSLCRGRISATVKYLLCKVGVEGGESSAARRLLRASVVACLHAQYRWAQVVDASSCHSKLSS